MRGDFLEITTREMTTDDHREVTSIAQKAFSFPESLFISKPKLGIVAEVDGKIAGAILYKFMACGNLKNAYIDYAFVHPDYSGKGVGSKLYEATTKFLWEQGCDTQSAIVKDDNVASWSLFLKNGYERIGVVGLVKEFGLAGFLKHYFFTPAFIAIGMDYYLISKTKKPEVKESGTAAQITAFLLFNVIVVLLSSFTIDDNYLQNAISLAIVLTFNVLTGFLGTLFTKRKWKFRFINGGLAIPILNISFGGLFPAIGSWYPEKYEKSSEFKRDMAIVSLATWVLSILFILVMVLLGESRNLITITLKVLMVIRIVTVYPTSAFGAMRVFNWNKIVYAVLLVLSVAVLMFV